MRDMGWVLGIVGVVAGCAATFPAVPGKGGPAWLELTSEHFTVLTDADRVTAHALVRQMEQVRQVVVGAAFPAAARGRILVFALRDDEELSLTRTERESRAFAGTAGRPMFQPFVVLSTFSNDGRTDETIMHELAHAISFAAIHRQPRWVSEGLAQYFQTMQHSLDNTMFDVGVAPRHGAQRQRMPALVPISTLFAWAGDAPWSPAEARHYSTAWALFTFLINAHRDELVHFLQLLDDSARSSGSLPTQPELWQQAFPSLPLAEVDGDLRQWLVSGHHTVLHFRVQARDWPVRERVLSDAEVLAVQGYLIADEKQEQSRMAAALALDPTNVLAWLIELHHRNVKISAATGRAMAAAHGDDWRAWWLASQAIAGENRDPAEAAAAAAKACALIAENPALVAPPKLCPANTTAPRAIAR